MDSATNLEAIDPEPWTDRELGGIPYILARSAELHPHRTAIRDLGSGASASYGSLHASTNRLAHALRRLGIRKGDRIALMFGNEIGLIEALFACAKAGAVMCSVNARLLPQEVKTYLQPHAIRAIICNPAFAGHFAGVETEFRIVSGAAPAEGGPWLEAEALSRGEPDTPLRPVTTLGSPFRMIPTGGTTGASKGVVHSHGGTLMTIAANIAEFGIRRGWKTLLIAPLFHGAAMDWALFPILWRSGTVILPRDRSFNAENFLATVREHRVEYLLVVPAVIGAIHKAWDGVPLDCVKSIITTSAPTSPTLRAKLAEVFPGADIMAGAGISESLNMAVQSPGELLAHPASIGEAHMDTRMCIVDEAGRTLPRMRTGEICLRGFNTALYYNANAEATARTWKPRADDPEGLEWCFTGDIGFMDEEGRLTLVDRSKDVIITGGETVPSVEIESAYAGHPAIAECAAVGLAHEQWGEAITLIVAKNDPALDEEVLAKDLFDYGRSRLSGFKVPKQIAFLDALPRSHMGKLLKAALRTRQYGTLYDSKQPAPENTSKEETP